MSSLRVCIPYNLRITKLKLTVAKSNIITVIILCKYKIILLYYTCMSKGFNDVIFYDRQILKD